MTSVVILAGGRSTRMGENKALLPDASRRGASLLDCACRLAETVLSDLGEDVRHFYVSGAYPFRQCIEDIIPGGGPLSGMHAALEFMLGEREGNCRQLLFIPVDMPALTAATVVSLVREAQDASSVCFYGHKLPVLIRVARDISGIIADRLRAPSSAREARSVSNLLGFLGVRALDVPLGRESEFINVNTPSEFAVWCQEVVL